MAVSRIHFFNHHFFDNTSMNLAQTPLRTSSSPSPATDFDAIVVGAGFGGMYMLHKLRDQLGLKVKVFDTAAGIGGTWYWNRYPGALSDTHSHVYQYSFNEALLQEWTWKNKYLTQPEILAYLEFVADRLDLRPDIQLSTTVTSMRFDENRNIWEVRTDRGGYYTARFIVTALGLLSAINWPNIPGRESFQGEMYHTAAWPKDVELHGKRVGVIGTGSTGVQLITAIAPEVKHLTVFQRTPQYSVADGKSSRFCAGNRRSETKFQPGMAAGT